VLLEAGADADALTATLPELPSHAIMLLPFLAQQPAIERCRTLGFATYLAKPFTPAKLRAAIVGALARIQNAVTQA
jgi:CheY-like chemotaxis protein